MNKRIEVDELHTISDCLQALSDITLSIDDIKMQLEYSAGDKDWRFRANLALRKCKHVSKAIQGKLSVLRQAEKEQNVRLNCRRNDFLVHELRPHVPADVYLACKISAELRASQELADDAMVDEFINQVSGQEKPTVHLPMPIQLWGLGPELFKGSELITFIEKQGFLVEVSK
ncbi:hypothetical protein [Serratia fonticola]|uniref:Uncharacterized protein n=1 Tax=Serratia fonticola TaxID=47917 RepID=A0AAW3WS48_SERFO|nr:hypothetical protein [Serratia fonticola]MBC3213829.1 hypothetical protein [Serratia fonticola]NYA13102.1 hypothetical protein [Serratia fonticola]NYA33429.1 hypothetical protein [Serratia fonticola]